MTRATAGTNQPSRNGVFVGRAVEYEISETLVVTPRPRPLPILLPEEVPGQVSKAEVIRHQARTAARWRVALALFKLGGIIEG